MSAPSPASRTSPTRESVTTINADGSRRFLFPSEAHGRFTRWRKISAVLLLVIYLALPWVPVGGYPAVFLDLALRRFHFFGYTLAAQDAWLLFFGVTGLGFSLFFITALFGRVWCGWACPQTVFLEHVYRRVEQWVEGDAVNRRLLDQAPWTGGKLMRRTVKHVLYMLISLVIAHLFLAYFVSIPELWHMMRSAPGDHWSAFVFVFACGLLLNFNFAWFREQLCIVICPYGRLQSALVDDNSMVIGYDAKRGEPRGHARHDPGQPLGDCVACNRCVHVCPTGIDIRQGLQIECIGCAACIDACDEVMARTKRPPGLVRYDSLAGLAGGRTRWVRPRTILYGVLLLVGIAVASFAFSTVKAANFSVVRMSGAAYFVDSAAVRNQFLVRLLNKRSAPMEMVVIATGLPSDIHATGLGVPVTIPPMAEVMSPVVLTIDRARYRGPFEFVIHAGDTGNAFQLQRKVQFLGPDPKLLKEEDLEKGITR